MKIAGVDVRKVHQAVDMATMRLMGSAGPGGSVDVRPGVVSAIIRMPEIGAGVRTTVYEEEAQLCAHIADLDAVDAERGVVAAAVTLPERDTVARSALERAGYRVDEGLTRWGGVISRENFRFVRADGVDYDDRGALATVVDILREAGTEGWQMIANALCTWPTVGRARVWQARLDGDVCCAVLTVDATGPHGRHMGMPILAYYPDAGARQAAVALVSAAVVDAYERGCGLVASTPLPGRNGGTWESEVWGRLGMEPTLRFLAAVREGEWPDEEG